MSVRAGASLTLTIERPAVGGRMIARADGTVVLVAGAIPGEVVEARVERVQKHTAWATTTRVLEPSADRVDCAPGLACGGHVLAHVAAPRQLALKAEMIADALRRVGKIALDAPVPMTGGPHDGYRTRARVHVRQGRAGFFEAGTHALCDVAASRQLSDASAAILDRLVGAVVAARPDAEAEVDWVENADGSERVSHIALTNRRPGPGLDGLPGVDGLDGARWSVGEHTAGRRLWGQDRVTDAVIAPTPGGSSQPVAIAHGARAFFQGNRFLLQPLVDEVLARLIGPRVCDLYAGVGIFAVAAGAAGHVVDAVEGDEMSAADLVANAAGWSTVTSHHGAVEEYLGDPGRVPPDTVVVDPPRTGVSPEALAGVLAWQPSRIVYVSCDPATLARDLRRCLDHGYRLGGIRGFDLFPRTGHVETVVTLDR